MSHEWADSDTTGDDLPLAGVRVVEVSQVLSGAFCSMLLGDLGADVIKIEHPDGGDLTRIYGPPFVGQDTYYFQSINRNKRSVALNLKTPDGRETLNSIVRSSDVLVHNYLPIKAEKLGLTYEKLPDPEGRLIHCAMSGFPSKGTNANKSALDIVLQAAAGAMSITGTEDSGPLRTPIPVADITAALFASSAILAALYRRHSTGKGEQIDVSLYQSLAASMPYHWGEFFVDSDVPARRGNAHPSMVPYNCYPTSDGHVVIAVNSDVQWQRFSEVLGLSEQLSHTFPSNAERIQHRDEIDAAVEKAFQRYRRRELVDILESVGVPCAAVESFDEVAAGELMTLAWKDMHSPRQEEVTVVAPPIRLRGRGVSLRRQPPRLGEHTEEVIARVVAERAR